MTFLGLYGLLIFAFAVGGNESMSYDAQEAWGRGLVVALLVYLGFGVLWGLAVGMATVWLWIPHSVAVDEIERNVIV